MTWWFLVFTSVSIALAVRILALFGPAYFTWLELIPYLGEDQPEHASLRSRTLRLRLAVPFLILFTAGLAPLAPVALWEAAVAGAAGAGLLLWPMVFHGYPYGIFRWQWVLVPAYGSLVGLFAVSASLGAFTASLVTGRAEGVHPLLENLAYAALMASGAALLWWVQARSNRALSILATTPSEPDT